MALTYADVKNPALRSIGDADGSLTGTDIALDAVKAALDAVLPWYANQKSAVLTADEDNDTLFALPADLYEIDAVVDDSDGLVLEKAVLSPGTYTGEGTSSLNWIEYPKGTLVLSSEGLETSETLTLYYRAIWTHPVGNDADPLDIPDFMRLAIQYYAASYMLIEKASEQAKLGGYKTKVDSGNPEHLPLKEHVTFLRDLFYDEVGRFPTQVKGQV